MAGIEYFGGSGGGGGTPAGSDTWVQYNHSGAFGANANFTTDTNGNIIAGNVSSYVAAPLTLNTAAFNQPTILVPQDSYGVIFQNGPSTPGGEYAGVRFTVQDVCWTDNVVATYFQFYQKNTNNVVFLGGTGGADAVMARCQIDAVSNQLTDNFFSATPPPDSLVEVLQSGNYYDIPTLSITGISSFSSNMTQWRQGDNSNTIVAFMTQNGLLNVSAFQLPTGATNNYVLTSDGAGNGTWQASSGAVSSVSNSDGTITISPTTGVVVASLNLSHANSWTALQTFNGSDIAMKGTSTGTTTIATANTSATNYTLTLPAVTGTLAIATDYVENTAGTLSFATHLNGGTFIQTSGNSTWTLPLASSALGKVYNLICYSKYGGGQPRTQVTIAFSGGDTFLEPGNKQSWANTFGNLYGGDNVTVVGTSLGGWVIVSLIRNSAPNPGT